VTGVRALGSLDFKSFAEAFEACGWERIDVKGSSHTKFKAPTGELYVLSPNMADWRAAKNSVSDLRKFPSGEVVYQYLLNRKKPRTRTRKPAEPTEEVHEGEPDVATNEELRAELQREREARELAEMEMAEMKMKFGFIRLTLDRAEKESNPAGEAALMRLAKDLCG
jgi:hypothetical protein